MELSCLATLKSFGLACPLNRLLMHDFVTSSIGHLENIDSWSVLVFYCCCNKFPQACGFKQHLFLSVSMGQMSRHSRSQLGSLVRSHGLNECVSPGSVLTRGSGKESTQAPSGVWQNSFPFHASLWPPLSLSQLRQAEYGSCFTSLWLSVLFPLSSYRDSCNLDLPR